MEEINFINQRYEIVFESENIYYVKLDEKLVNDYLKMVNDPNVANKISHKTRTYTYEQELNWLKSKLEENALCFYMLEKNTGEYIGNIEIMEIENNIGELGISITASKQNKHYGTESIKALLKYSYEILVDNREKISRKYSECVVDKITLENLMLLIIKGEK